MGSFTKNSPGSPSTFGKNEYKRSTVGLKFGSVTLAANSVPYVAVANGPAQKILQPGTVLAKITSGPDTGKYGPFQAAGTADKWTATPGGTWSAGTFTVTVSGIPNIGSLTTAAIPFGAANTVVQAACDAAFGAGNVTVTGGPQATTATVYTAGGNFSGPLTMAVNIGSITGSSPTVAMVHTVTGVVGALDGRSTSANIIGLLETYCPWQLLEHDVDVAHLYDGTVVQGWCFEYDVNGVAQVLGNTTAAFMIAQKSMSITFF